MQPARSPARRRGPRAPKPPPARADEPSWPLHRSVPHASPPAAAFPASQVHGLAVVAALDLVALRELGPVPALLRAQLPGPLAEGAGVGERGQDRLADELRSVGDPIDQVGEGVVDLERDEIALHGRPLGEARMTSYYAPAGPSSAPTPQLGAAPGEEPGGGARQRLPVLLQ